jgi:hypothetical protein
MVQPMHRKGLVVALSALACLLSACGGGVRAKGSAAISAFLAATQREDRKAFEAGLDRPALRSDLRGQLADLGRAHGVDVGGASEFALDRMITPQAVRLTAQRVTSGWPAAPTAAQIIPHMKAPDRAHICLEEAASRRCLLSFAREGGAWRLVGMAFTPPPADAPSTP